MIDDYFLTDNGFAIRTDNDITTKLNKEYPIGQVLLNPIICEDGEIYYPSHKTTILNVKQFIEFLHYCEGFNIT